MNKARIIIRSLTKTPLKTSLSYLSSRKSQIKRIRTYNSATSLTRETPIEEDKSVLVSRNINCSSCGALLQCNDHAKPGFITAGLFKTLNNNDLAYEKCFNCELLNKNQKVINLNEFENYEDIILQRIIKEKNSLVIILIDLLDIPNSIDEIWTKLKYQNINKKETDEGGKIEGNFEIKDIQIILAGNKLDLLPNTGPGWLDSIKECLFRNCIKKGIKGRQIKHIELISAKTYFNVENLINEIINKWNGKSNIYLLGMTNAGKSMLFNALIDSDLCDINASQALNKATVSQWPNTTCNLLKFPLQFINKDMMKLRKKRLALDNREQNELDAKREERFKQTHKLNDAIFECIRGNSFLESSNYSGNIDTNVDASFVFNELNGQIDHGKLYEDTNEIIEERIQVARKNFNYSQMNNRYCLYDTPGLIKHQKILTKLTRTELENAIPNKLITPKILWMVPGQTFMIGGLIRIDLLESTNSERVLFSILANSNLPLIEPFDSKNADSTYQDFLNENRLKVPELNSECSYENFTTLKRKKFTIECIGNHMSTSDIVFSIFGWVAITSKPNVQVTLNAFTIDEDGLQLRQPSLLPFVVNMRHAKCYENSQIFRKKFILPSYKILKTKLKKHEE